MQERIKTTFSPIPYNIKKKTSVFPPFYNVI